MKFKEFMTLNRDEIYKLVTDNRISVDTPTENSSRDFPIGSRAYIWTNEALSGLESSLHIDLAGRDMLIVSASGDPFATFAYFGAKNQVGFDTSHRAALWSEVKLAGIQALDYEEFKMVFGIASENHKEESKLWKKVEDNLSEYAKSVWGKLVGTHKTIRKVISNGNYFRQYCSGAFPNANLYCESKTKYEKARANLRDNKQILIPGGLNDVQRLVEKKFGGFYASNILDHFKDGNGNYSGSEISLAPFLGSVDECMRRDAIMIFNFEHNTNVRVNTDAILRRMGYKMRFAEKSGEGYGTIALASRAGRKKQ